MDLAEGLRKLFGFGAGQRVPARAQQAQQYVDQAQGGGLRAAPVQAGVPGIPLSSTGVPAFDQAEAERIERERLLQQELLRLRNGG